MPADLLQRVNLDLIYPEFLCRVLDMLAACRTRGVDYWATRGTATWLEQHKLRLAYLEGKGGRAAQAGYSQHNYGLAIDFAPDADTTREGLQPVWDSKAFDVLVDECAKHGLVSGRSFGDAPHVGWPGWEGSLKLSVLLNISTRTQGSQLDKLKAVWAYLDSQPQPGGT